MNSRSDKTGSGATSGKTASCPESPLFERYYGIPLKDAPENPAAHSIRRIILLHATGDLLGLFLAYSLTVFLRLFVLPHLHLPFLTTPSVPHLTTYVFGGWYYILLSIPPLFFLYSILGLYSGNRRLRHTPVFWNLLLSNGTLIALIVFALYFDRNTWHMRSFLPMVFVLNILTTFVLRWYGNSVLAEARLKDDRLRYPVLLVGKNANADLIRSFSDEHRIKGYRVAEQVEAPKTPEAVREVIPPLLEKSKAQFMMLLDDTMPQEVWDTLWKVAGRHNIGVFASLPAYVNVVNPFAYGDFVGGKALSHFAPILYSVRSSKRRAQLEKLLAGIALVLLSPVFLLLIILIRLDSPGPAFFKQWRYGKDNKRFQMYKFRSMCADAEAKMKELRGRNESDGALFKMHDDPRVTKIGRFLRKTSLDELPQLVNIWRGEMRFVGPRPLPCKDLDPYMDSWQIQRQLVEPGLTCIWQCSGRSDIRFNMMSLLDIWYAHNRTWILDVRIVIRTAWTVLFSRGAY